MQGLYLVSRVGFEYAFTEESSSFPQEGERSGQCVIAHLFVERTSFP